MLLGHALEGGVEVFRQAAQEFLHLLERVGSVGGAEGGSGGAGGSAGSIGSHGSEGYISSGGGDSGGTSPRLPFA